MVTVLVSSVVGPVLDANPDVICLQEIQADHYENHVYASFSEAGYEGVESHWLSYLAVDDVDKRVAQMTSSGASVERAPFDVPNVGRIAVVRDPGGAVLGLLTPAESG